MTKDEALKLALEALEEPKEHFAKHRRLEAITAIKEALAQPEFIKHEVENADDWSEWVCPDPKGYLMKCCDCGLVHEAEFGVVRYKSETEREDCDIVDDPNLQAVFRMRRSEQWLPEDTAHRAGGLPMAQPEQDGECKYCADGCLACDARKLPEQEPVAHSVVAGALFDFMGWLTSRNKRLTLSGADEASPEVEAIQEFSEKRGLSLKHAEVGFWTEFLSTPPPCQTCEALARTVMMDQTGRDA